MANPVDEMKNQIALALKESDDYPFIRRPLNKVIEALKIIDEQNYSRFTSGASRNMESCGREVNGICSNIRASRNPANDTAWGRNKEALEKDLNKLIKAIIKWANSGHITDKVTEIVNELHEEASDLSGTGDTFTAYGGFQNNNTGYGTQYNSNANTGNQALGAPLYIGKTD